jgi:hypothetical protein
MFILKKDPTIWAPVAWNIAADATDADLDAGHLTQPQTTASIRIKFKLLDRKSIVEFSQAAQERITALTEKSGDAPALLAEQGKLDALIQSVILDWKGVHDETGTAIPFTPEGLAQLMTLIGVSDALLVAFYKATSGGEAREKAIEKNALTPLATGPAAAVAAPLKAA